MTEEEYRSYGLPTEEVVAENSRQHSLDCGRDGYLDVDFYAGAMWMRRKAVEVIDKLNEDNLKALAKILLDK